MSEEQISVAAEPPVQRQVRTPEQVEWIRARYNPDALLRLARATPDYYEHKGSYLPDVSALAYIDWERAEKAEDDAARLRDALLGIESEVTTYITGGQDKTELLEEIDKITRAALRSAS